MSHKAEGKSLIKIIQVYVSHENINVLNYLPIIMPITEDNENVYSPSY